jgi:hypothetical protein
VSPRLNTSLLAALAALVALVVLAGCGGGDSGSTSGTAESQPAAELVKQADSICREEDAKRPKPPTIPPNPSQQELQSTADYFKTDLQVTQQTLDRLSQLAPPDGKEDQWATVLDGYRVVIDNYPAMIKAAEAGDEKAFVKAVGKIQGGTQDLAPAAADVGLQVCARPG